MTTRISEPRMIFLIMTLFLAGFQLGAQMPKQQALTKTLECPQADCQLLHGVPETSGMRSGFVRLAPDQDVGWHSTGQNEEALVILHGKGAALIEGQPERAFTAPALAYYSSRDASQRTEHWDRNAGVRLCSCTGADQMKLDSTRSTTKRTNHIASPAAHSQSQSGPNSIAFSAMATGSRRRWRITNRLTKRPPNTSVTIGTAVNTIHFNPSGSERMRSP